MSFWHYAIFVCKAQMLRPSDPNTTIKFFFGAQMIRTLLLHHFADICVIRRRRCGGYCGYHVTEQVAPVAGGQLHPALRRQTAPGDLLVAVEHGLAPLLHTAAGVRAS